MTRKAYHTYRLPSLELTTRERQVGELIRQGLSNKGIAEQLEISTNTVKRHTASLYWKLGLRPDEGVQTHVRHLVGQVLGKMRT
jgi:DNA-binding NarL/FixJ family response regulator